MEERNKNVSHVHVSVSHVIVNCFHFSATLNYISESFEGVKSLPCLDWYHEKVLLGTHPRIDQERYSDSSRYS